MAVERSRQHGFGNCDMQALEVALHLHHSLGVKDYVIYSNHKTRHNYVALNPCEMFPKGALIDTWTGKGIMELNTRNKFAMQHFAANLKVNHAMHEWVTQYGAQHVIEKVS